MMKANKTTEMLLFITIVEEGSLVAAAEKSNLSKQAVSRYLNALEDRLGVRLLQRTTRKIALTEVGQNFYQQSKMILDSIDAMESQVSQNQIEPLGHLRINVPVSFGILRLAPLWQEFRKLYPKIKLEITLSDQTINLVEENYDLAVRVGTLDDSTLIAQQLTSSRIIAAASPDYLDSHSPIHHPDQLKAHSIIAYSYWNRQQTWEFWQNNQRYEVSLNPEVYCNNGDTCRKIMLDGGGISLQPNFIIGEDIEKGDLIEILPNYQVKEYPVYVLYPSRKLLPLRVRVFIDFLKKSLPESAQK